jgi:dTMP kinase
LNLDPEEGLSRSRGNDRFEVEDLAFHAKVADAYLRIADEHPDRFRIIDASGTPEEVHLRVKGALDRFLQPEEGA